MFSFTFHSTVYGIAAAGYNIGLFADTVTEAVERFESVFGPEWESIDIPTAYWGKGQ